jgi:hypothetical protein
MARGSLIAFPLWFGNDVLSMWFFKVWKTGKSLQGLSLDNRVDGAVPD